MDNPNKMTLGAYYLPGFPTPFMCYLREEPLDPSKENQPPTPMMDRKLLFDLLAQTNVQRFECHGRSIEIDFSPSDDKGPEKFALEGAEEDTVDGELVLWNVSSFGGKAHRMGYEDVSKLSPGDSLLFAYTVKVEDDPENPEFKKFNIEVERTKKDETKDSAMTATMRIGKAFFRRMGSFLMSFGGDMHTGMYDAKPADQPNAPKP